MEPPTVIQLQTCVPLTAFQTRVLELQQLLPASAPPGLLPTDWLQADVSHLQTHPEVTSASRRAFLAIHSYWDLPPGVLPDAIHICTDGSATMDPLRFAHYAHQCTWAFCVWFSMPDGHDYLYGWSAHSSAPYGTPYHVGEVSEDSLTGEQLAIFWALAWVTEFASAFAAPVILHVDSQSAGRGAFAECRAASVGTPRARPLHEAVICLRHCATCRATLVHRHVAAHSGVLGNELADALARVARTTREPFDQRMLPSWPSLLVRHQLADWAWLQMSDFPDLPRLFAFQTEAARLQLQEEPIYPPPPPVSPPTLRPTAVNMCLTFATFNALSMLDSRPSGHLPADSGTGDRTAVGMKVVGKRELMKRQWIALGVHLVGLQETRIGETAVLPDQDFIMIHSSATPAGRLGVALWASKKEPYVTGPGLAHCFLREHFTVLQHSPRHLLLQLTAPCLRLQLIVAHAPHERCDSETAEAFWARVFSAVDLGPTADPVVILMDSNAHLGSELTSAVGPLSPEKENAPAVALHRWLLTANLALPSTFPDRHTGPSGTWVSPLDAERRLDFVAIPLEWLPAAVSTTVLGFEMLQDREDHRPALVSCTLAQCQHAGPYRVEQRRCALRPASGHDKGQLQTFLHLVSHGPPVPWHWNSDHHYEAWLQ